MDFREQYFNVWSQAWQLHKKFYGNDGSDQAWEQVIDESSKIVKEYEDKSQYKFMRDLVLATLSELERVNKKRRLKNNGQHD